MERGSQYPEEVAKRRSEIWLRRARMIEKSGVLVIRKEVPEKLLEKVADGFRRISEMWANSPVRFGKEKTLLWDDAELEGFIEKSELVEVMESLSDERIALKRHLTEMRNAADWKKPWNVLLNVFANEGLTLVPLDDNIRSALTKDIIWNRKRRMDDDRNRRMDVTGTWWCRVADGWEPAADAKKKEREEQGLPVYVDDEGRAI